MNGGKQLSRVVVRGRELLGALGLTLAAACSPEEPTEIVPGVSTQMRIPEGIKTVAVVVSASGRSLHCETYPVVEGQVTLPATLGILGGNANPSSQVTVNVLGFRSEEPAFSINCDLGGTIPNTADPDAADQDDRAPNELVIVRRRRLGFDSNRILFLPMPLKESCNDVHCDEEAGETCIGGKCVAMDVDAAIFPDYKDEFVFGNTNTCFNPDLCLAAGATAPVRLIDRDTCTFETVLGPDAPLTEPGNLNVRVHYNTFGTEILDLDWDKLDASQHEGISLPDPDGAPLQFRLAPNLCDSNFLDDDKILRLEASPVCPTKTQFQPICDATLDLDPDNDPIGVGGLSVAEPGTCKVASLRSVESAAYVLMDRSLSMFRYFGEGGLRFAVELPLSSPIARRTRLAFDLMPADVAECSVTPEASSYATPQVEFAPELDALASVREPIGNILGDPAQVLPDNPPIYMAQAMSGAYQALRALVPVTEGGDFNRKALVVIANRDFGGFCSPDGLTPLEVAQNAFINDGIYTYTVVLDEGEDAAAVVDATSIASAGGTTVFNGVADEAEGAKAVQDILNDLGSCLYDVVAPLTFETPVPDDAAISYLDPFEPGGEPVLIPRIAAGETPCTEDTQDTASGWSVEDRDNDTRADRIRICGAPCEALRTLLDEVAISSAVLGSVAPPVPLVLTASCPDSFPAAL